MSSGFKTLMSVLLAIALGASSAGNDVQDSKNGFEVPQPVSGNASAPGVVQMDVINGIRVPKDPGAANNATVSGIDSDKNGSRDDIDRFVALTFGNDPEKFNEAMFLSRMQFNAYLRPDPKTQQEAQDQIQESFYNYHCFRKEFGSEIVSTSRIPDLIEAMYMNTRLRKSFHQKIVSLAGVMSIQFHSDPSKLCTGGIK